MNKQQAVNVTPPLKAQHFHTSLSQDYQLLCATNLRGLQSAAWRSNQHGALIATQTSDSTEFNSEEGRRDFKMLTYMPGVHEKVA